MDEHHHVGVLLDGARFAQVRLSRGMLSLPASVWRLSWARHITGTFISRARPFSRRAILATCSCRGSLGLSGSMSCK